MNSVQTVTILALTLVTAACSSTNPTAPSDTLAAPAEPVTIQYAINIPNPITAQDLLRQYPNGRLMAPIAAQLAYDYSATYHAANVYYGPLAPPAGAYTMAGIVVAPVGVASQTSFTGAEWPTLYGANERVQWLGRFTYTIANCQTAAAVPGCR